MNNRLIIAGSAVALGFLSPSCQTQLDQVATPEPTPALAEVSGKSFVSLKEGYGVYMKHCAQCHEHRLPDTPSLPAWHAKIETMSEMAGLSKSEEMALQDYLDEFSDR